MRTGLLRIRQEYIGLIVGFATMGGVFTQTNKREGTVDGTGLLQHILRLSPQQGDLQDAS